METKYTFVHFIKVDQKPKTSVWSCRNNRSNNELGEVKWHGPWRQYCYFPTVQAVYSAGCLRDIKDFVTGCSLEHDLKEPDAAIVARCELCEYGAEGGGGNFGLVAVVCCYFGPDECEPNGDCEPFQVREDIADKTGTIKTPNHD